MPLSVDQPAYALHAAVTHLDRAADQLLKDRFGIGYQRFLLMLTVDRLGPTTQRAIAEEMAGNEPGTSRHVAAAERDGVLAVTTVPGRGNRRQVTLTDGGATLLAEALAMLEDAFAGVAEAAGIDTDAVLDLAGRILAVVAPGSSAALDAGTG